MAPNCRSSSLSRWQRNIEHGDMRLEPHRHARRIGADHAAAEHHDFRRRHARHAAEQHAASALRDLETVRARLDRHAPRHFAHRRQQRQAAARIGDRLIGDADRAGIQQPVRLLRIGREMQIGEKRLARAQPLDLDRLRLLHLHDHVGGGEHLVRVVDRILRADARDTFRRAGRSPRPPWSRRTPHGRARSVRAPRPASCRRGIRGS